jgi:hypothetical protein
MRREFRKLLQKAIEDFAQNGYDVPDRLAYWVKGLRIAARLDMPSVQTEQARITRALSAIYQRIFTQVDKTHTGAQWDRAHVSAKYQNLLRERINASADLIVLNREKAIETTLSRFSGWASSVPTGGSRIVEKREVTTHIGKPLQSQTYEERRLHIDQGHKLISNVNRTIAEDQGAIAAEWRSRWRQANYDYRPDHKDRDKRVFVMRGNWAMEKGLMKAGKDGYTDQITQPGEEVFCRCSYRYIYALRDLPDDMLTAKGRKALGR